MNPPTAVSTNPTALMALTIIAPFGPIGPKINTENNPLLLSIISYRGWAFGAHFGHEMSYFGPITGPCGGPL